MSNKQLPFQGLDQAYWSHLLGRQEHSVRNIKQIIMDLINGKSEKLGPGDLLIVASRCVSQCEPCLFEKFFSIVRKKSKSVWGVVLKRRIVIRIPSYSIVVSSQIRDIMAQTIRTLPIPQELIQWYVQVITVIPAGTRPIRDLGFGGVRTAIPEKIGSLLDTLTQVTPALAKPTLMGNHTVMMWDGELPLDAWQKIVSICLTLPQKKCKCAEIHGKAPSTKNNLGHVVLRHKKQYQEVFSPKVAEIFIANARDRFWWSQSSKEAAIEDMLTKIGQLTLPPPMLSDTTIHPIPILNPETLQKIKKVVLHDTKNHEGLPEGIDPLTDDRLPEAKKELKSLNLVAGIWDKCPTQFYAICSTLRDDRILSDMLGG